MSNEYIVPTNQKSFGTYSNTRAKLMNNPIGAVAGGVLAWYVTKKYTGIENKWAYTGIIILGVVVGAYSTSYIKRKINDIKN
jgi:hypothetical protein